VVTVDMGVGDRPDHVSALSMAWPVGWALG
jgi:hypothetical protein